MLRITIEVLPGGREDSTKVVGRGQIGNVSDLADLSDYVCRFEEGRWGRDRGPYFGTLAGWPRKERGVWEIVHAALTVVLNAPPKPERS